MAAAMSASVKDRTREFAAAAERAAKTLAQRQGGGPPTSSGSTGVSVGDATNPLLPGSASHPSSSAPSQAAGTNSEFAKMSSRIGHGIHGTSQKLEKLTALAKRSSMFDDPAREIAELSAVIKSDITALNTAIAELQNHAARVSATKQGSDHSVTVVDTLKTRLMGATKSFKEVLTMRQENVKAQSERRKMFSNESKVPNRPNPFARPRGPDGKMVGGGGGPGGFLQGGTRDAGGFDGHITGNNYGNAQNQVLLANQDQYMNSRSEALQNVERTITELGGIFQQLSTMVAEQGEMAVRIDENVEQSVANVDAAQTQLLKYLNSVSSNRWLIMKIFGVLISFLVFFIVFIA
jgi:syntaxin 5